LKHTIANQHVSDLDIERCYGMNPHAAVFTEPCYQWYSTQFADTDRFVQRECLGVGIYTKLVGQDRAASGKLGQCGCALATERQHAHQLAVGFFAPWF